MICTHTHGILPTKFLFYTQKMILQFEHNIIQCNNKRTQESSDIHIAHIAHS